MTRYASDHLVSRLVAAGSALGQQIISSSELTLRDYLRSLVPQSAGNGNRYREWLATALASFCHQRGIPGDDVAAHLLSVPVIQQADHSNLLLDNETFLNNYLFHLGCRLGGATMMITSQCSTVSCLTRREPVAGPVFLRSRESVYLLFALSKRTLKNSTFCLLPPPLRLSFELLSGSWEASRDPLLSRLAAATYHAAPEAFRAANEVVWQALGLGAVTRIAVDESMTSEAIAIHLEHATSPLSRLVLEPPIRAQFLAVKRELVASRRNLSVNRAAPDFFWYRDGARLVPAVIRGEGPAAQLFNDISGELIPVPLRSGHLRKALREGVLYGDRILAYLVRSVFPDVTAVGGTSQQDYLRLYCEMLQLTDSLVPFLDSAEAAVLSRPDLSRLGGSPLLELDSELQRLLQYLSYGTRLDDFESAVLDRRVGESIGQLSCARYFEPRLHQLLNREASA